MYSFISGIYMTSFAASGFFFFKFYRKFSDRFFLGFAGTCWLLALERVVLLLFSDPAVPLSSEQIEAQSMIYIIRMIAFLILVIAVVDKNRRGSDLKE